MLSQSTQTGRSPETRCETSGERVLYSTAQVLPPQSAPHLDWEQVGPFLLSPHGGLPWLLLVMFLGWATTFGNGSAT